MAAMMGWPPSSWGWPGVTQPNFFPSMNLAGPPHLNPAPTIPTISQPTQNLVPPIAQSSGQPSSPAPSDNNLELDDFFRFAHVEPNQKLLDSLEELGIAHYSHFHSFSAGDLEGAGVKMGHARILMDNLKRYEQHIKSHHNANHAH